MPVAPGMPGKESDAFSRFLSWSNQKELCGHAIRELLPERQGALLDVGAGDGELTRLYIDRFDSALLVEPSAAQAEKLRARCGGDNIQILKRGVEEIEIEQRFRAVVLSHVLSQLSDPLALVSRCAAMLEPDGFIVAVLSDPDSELVAYRARFFSRIHGHDPDSGALWTEVAAHGRALGLAVESHTINAVLSAPSSSAMLSVGEFVFSVQGEIEQPLRLEMDRYLNDNHARDDGSLCLSQTTKLVVLRACRPDQRPGNLRLP